MPPSPMTSISLPIGCQRSDQNRTELPSCISMRRNERARGLRCSNLFQTHDPAERALTSNYCLTQAIHSEFKLAKIRQISFREKTVSISLILLIPNPSSAFGVQTTSQITFALWVILGDPLHKKAEHILSISSMKPWGKEKAEHQKFVILAITVWINCRRPTKDRALLVQLSNLLRTLANNGSQSERDMIFVVRGNPKYFIGKAETDNPTATASFPSNCFPLPTANTIDLDTLMHRPDKVAKSLKTSKVPWRDWGLPSVKTTMSSAKLGWVRLISL